MGNFPVYGEGLGGTCTEAAPFCLSSVLSCSDFTEVKLLKM